MGTIINELRQRLNKVKAPMVERIVNAKRTTKRLARALAITRHDKKSHPAHVKKRADKLRAALKRCDSDIETAKAEIKALGMTVSKDHPLIHFDGEQAEKQCMDFVIWAAGARGHSLASKDGRDFRDIRSLAKAGYYDDRQRFFTALIQPDRECA